MAEQTRRRAPKNMTRRERRASGVRTYDVPRSATSPSVAPRRSYMAEPAPVDYSVEYYYVRKDLMRILLWATVLIGAIIVLGFLPIF